MIYDAQQFERPAAVVRVIVGHDNNAEMSSFPWLSDMKQ